MKITKKLMNKFNIELLFHKFLESGGITKDQIPKNQYTEMKKAFFGGFGQAIKTMRDDVTQHSESESIVILESLQEQILSYFEQSLIDFENDKKKSKGF